MLHSVNSYLNVCCFVSFMTLADTEQTLVIILRDLAQRFPQELQNAVMSLPNEMSTKLRTALG